MAAPGSIFIIAVLHFTTHEKLQQFVTLQTPAANVAQKDEPGTLKYAAFLPREAGKETELWVFEEYADQATMDGHMKQPAVASMLSWLEANPAPAPASIQLVSYPSAALRLSRARIDTAEEDPFIAFSELNYQAAGAKAALPQWQAVVDAAKSSEETLLLSVLTDEKHPDKLFVVEAHTSEARYQDLQAESRAAVEGAGVKRTVLRRIAGFLHK